VHPPRAASRAEATALARERERAFDVAVRATQVNEAGVRDAARQDRVRVYLKERHVAIPPCIDGLLLAIDALTEHVKAFDQELSYIAAQDLDCVRVMSAPGVGPATAVRFGAALDVVDTPATPAARKAARSRSTATQPSLARGVGERAGGHDRRGQHTRDVGAATPRRVRTRLTRTNIDVTCSDEAPGLRGCDCPDAVIAELQQSPQARIADCHPPTEFLDSARAVEGTAGRPTHSPRMMLTLWTYAVSQASAAIRRYEVLDRSNHGAERACPGRGLARCASCLQRTAKLLNEQRDTGDLRKKVDLRPACSLVFSGVEAEKDIVLIEGPRKPGSLFLVETEALASLHEIPMRVDERLGPANTLSGGHHSRNIEFIEAHAREVAQGGHDSIIWEVHFIGGDKSNTSHVTTLSR
jgi:hypothetical protein